MTLLKGFLKKICEKKFVEAWFKYSSYLLIAATLVAAGRKSDSIFLQGVGYISGAAVFLHLVNELVDIGRQYRHDDKNAGVDAASMFLMLALLALLAGSAFPFIESLMK